LVIKVILFVSKDTKLKRHQNFEKLFLKSVVLYFSLQYSSLLKKLAKIF